MNSEQRIVLIIVSVVILLIALFPPWIAVHGPGISETTIGHFPFWLNTDSDSLKNLGDEVYNVRVNLVVLILECLVAVGAAGLVIGLLDLRKVPPKIKRCWTHRAGDAARVSSAGR